MKLFAPLYDSVIRWAKHRYATYYLMALSFAESSFFPIPPDVMMLPMMVARQDKVWRYAWYTTLFSVLGGLAGYIIGYYAIEWVQPLIQERGYSDRYETVIRWFGEWGFWAVFIAGFSPVPYKLFTIAAGSLQLAVIPFVVASICGRGLRFFLLAFLVSRFGAAAEPMIRRYIEPLGWGVVVVLVLLIIWVKLI